MKRTFLPVIGLLLLLNACIPSLHPLYTPETLAFRRDLNGTWESSDDSGVYTWHFEPDEEQKSYSLIFSMEESKKERYEVHLVKLGSHYFLDLYPDDHQEVQGTLAYSLPTHSFGRIDFGDGQVLISLFDYDWLERLFKERKIRMKHETVDDGTIVLTASSEELQGFVLKYADEAEAYMEPMVLRKTAE